MLDRAEVVRQAGGTDVKGPIHVSARYIMHSFPPRFIEGEFGCRCIEEIGLFTEGSCLRPAESGSRDAWALVLGAQTNTGFHCNGMLADKLANFLFV